jgi:hypothetical protein
MIFFFKLEIFWMTIQLSQRLKTKIRHYLCIDGVLAIYSF